MDIYAFSIALKLCFTEREVDRLSARAIRHGLPDAAVMTAADGRLRVLLSADDTHDTPDGWGVYKSSYQDQEASQFVY